MQRLSTSALPRRRRTRLNSFAPHTNRPSGRFFFGGSTHCGGAIPSPPGLDRRQETGLSSSQASTPSASAMRSMLVNDTFQTLRSTAETYVLSSSHIWASASCDQPFSALSVRTCHASVPRRSPFAGFFLGGVGFAVTARGWQSALFASTEFASHMKGFRRRFPSRLVPPGMNMKSPKQAAKPPSDRPRNSSRSCPRWSKRSSRWTPPWSPGARKTQWKPSHRRSRSR